MLYRPSAYPGLRLRSNARLYPSGLNLVTEGRPDLLYIRIQNRGSQAVKFWHGPVPRGATGTGTDLPLSISEWTTQERQDATTLIDNYGESIAPGSIWEPTVAHTGPVYSLVSGSTNRSQVITGVTKDQEQGLGGIHEN